MEINLEAVQNLHGRVGESTLGKQLAPLHEQQNGMVLYQSLDAFLGVGGGFLDEIVRHGPSRSRACGKGGSDKGIDPLDRQAEPESGGKDGCKLGLEHVGGM